MRMNWFILFLVISGLIIIGGMIEIIRYLIKNKETRKIYSERQMAVRNKAYKYAFFVMVLYDLVNGFLNECGIVWCDSVLGVAIGVCIAGTIFQVMVICKDAYRGSYDDEQGISIKSRIGYIAIELVYWRLGLLYGNLIENGRLSIHCGMLVIALGSSIILIANLIHEKRKTPKEEVI